MLMPEQSPLLNLRQISHVGGHSPSYMGSSTAHRRSSGRLSSRGPAWNLCPLGNLRVRVGGGGGGAAGAPEEPAPPLTISSAMMSCSSRQAASDAAARLARRMFRCSSTEGRGSGRDDGAGGRAGASGYVAPPSRIALNALSSFSLMSLRCCSSGCASLAATPVPGGVCTSSTGSEVTSCAAGGLLVGGGVATPPYFDLVDIVLVDVNGEGGMPSLGEGVTPSLGENQSSGKRLASTSARV